MFLAEPVESFGFFSDCGGRQVRQLGRWHRKGPEQGQQLDHGHRERAQRAQERADGSRPGAVQEPGRKKLREPGAGQGSDDFQRIRVDDPQVRKLGIGQLGPAGFQNPPADFVVFLKEVQKWVFVESNLD